MNQTLPRQLLGRALRVLFLFVLAVSFPLVGHAQDSQLAFYVTPVFPESQVDSSERYFDLNLAPGETETLAVTLQNARSEAIQVAITPHTAYTNVHGVVEYGKDAEEVDPTLVHSLADLLETPEVIDLAGNETKTIAIPLHMPEVAFDGFLAGGLRIAEVVEEEETPEESSEGVAIKNEFAYVLGVVVSNRRDSVRPDLELLDVFADQLNYRNVISATLQNTTPTFVNRMAVEATVQKEGENDVLYEATAEQLQMAPNSHFHFPISLDGDRFQAGEYVLRLKATSGEEEWEWTRPFTIAGETARSLNRQDVTIDTSLNWWMIGTLVLLFFLLAFVIYWLIQKKRNQDKKQSQEAPHA